MAPILKFQQKFDFRSKIPKISREQAKRNDLSREQTNDFSRELAKRTIFHVSEQNKQIFTQRTNNFSRERAKRTND